MDEEFKKINRNWLIAFVIGMIIFGVAGYYVGFSAGHGISVERISQLEDELDSLEISYWKQVTLSEYLAIKTFDFTTEMASAGRGSVVLTNVNGSTRFDYTCSDSNIWSCELTEYDFVQGGTGGGGVLISEFHFTNRS